MRRIAGSVAIVTGASRGLGVPIVRALARERVKLVLAARTASEVEALADQLTAEGCPAIAVVTDVADPAARAEVIRRAEQEYGRVDILVNNAGLEHVVSFHRMDPEEIRRMVDVNLTSAMLLTALALPGMLERKRGHIVNMSSLSAAAGLPFDAVYAATKAGLVAFSLSLRSEYRGSGVSSSVILPGFVSDAGMYHRMEARSGAKAPRTLGTTTPQAVARAVVSAIKHDKPHVIVNPRPLRLLLAGGQLWPRLGNWSLRGLGVRRMMAEVAASGEPAAEPEAAVSAGAALDT
jgi:short-subunit dehydrogenase